MAPDLLQSSPVPGKMDSFKNYYHLLRIDSTAGDAAIKAAFRRLALRHHPDSAKDKRTAHRFREIREAYDVLSDPEKRRQYDQRRGTRSGGFGVTLDVLGLRLRLAVDAGLSGPGARRPKVPRRSAR